MSRMSSTIRSTDTAFPVSGSCSCRLTPRIITGLSLRRTWRPRSSTRRKPTWQVSQSTTVAPLLRVTTKWYRWGASSDHSSGSRPWVASAKSTSKLARVPELSWWVPRQLLR